MTFTHGTRYGYQKRGCRCDDCREWNAGRWDRYAKRSFQRMERGSLTHGTATAYRSGCRCKTCITSASNRQRELVERFGERLANGEVPHGTSTGYKAGCRCNECRESVRLSDWKCRYGMNEAQFIAWSNARACSLCGMPFSSRLPGLRKVVDHCHNTGRIRGFLHQGCNIYVAQGKASASDATNIFAEIGDYDAAYYVKHSTVELDGTHVPVYEQQLVMIMHVLKDAA